MAAATLAFDFGQSAVGGAFRLPETGAGNARKSVERSLDSDQTVISRCLSGDETAWEELVRIHTRPVYGICFRFTGSGQEAQDLTQEVFLRVFRTLHSFRAVEGSFSTWLTRVTRNLLIDHYRRSRQDRSTESIEERLPMMQEVGAAAPSARTTHWRGERPVKSSKLRCRSFRPNCGRR